MSVCETCGERPPPPKIGTTGRKPKKCLACQREHGNPWQRWLKKYAELKGPAEAAKVAKEQGVPFVGTAAAVAPDDASPRAEIMREKRLAIALYMHSSDADALDFAGYPPMSSAETRKLLKHVRSSHRELVDGSPAVLARMAFAAMAESLLLLQDRLPALSPGALSQALGPLHKIWDGVAGGASLGEVRITLGRPEKWSPKDEHELEKSVEHLDS